MRKTFLLTSILLLSASWALAQYSSGSDNNATGSSSDSNTGAYSGSSTGSETSSGEASQQGQKSSSMAPQSGTVSTSKMTFEGCLSESNGKFTLTDSSGTAYELTGKTANLKAHVGHTIEVTGRATGSGENAPGSMSGEQSNMEQTLDVSSFRHVSSKCKSSTH